MTRPRPLPFDRVRVFAPEADRLLPPLHPRRPAGSGVLALERLRREPATAPSASTASAMAGAMAVDESLGEGATGAAPAPAQADIVAPRPAATSPDRDGEPEYPPPDDSAAAEARATTMRGAVSAVARAVEETAVVRALAALLGQACSDEAMQDSGPWEFTLPLESVGFGASSVHLRLSFPSLQVRFDCRMPGVAALLLRHQDSLRVSLQRDVPGLTDVDIAIFDA